MPKRAGSLALAAIVASTLSFPSLALATIRVDETEIAQGENVVGGGTATLSDSQLNMTDVTADELFIDQDLSVSFSGGNDIAAVGVEGSATVELSFDGDNDVKEVLATGSSDVTVNANGSNTFEEIEADDQASLTINVTGENDFEEVAGYDDATITIQGIDCPEQDVINLGEDERDTQILTERGALAIDGVTVNLEAEEAFLGSVDNNVTIDDSTLTQSEGNEYAYIGAGGTMQICESVIDITGTIHSTGEMTIEDSDVRVEKPDPMYDEVDPYRIYSEAGITLLNEAYVNIIEGKFDGKTVRHVEESSDRTVDLKADVKVAPHRHADNMPEAQVSSLPTTGDEGRVLPPVMLAVAGAAAMWLATSNRGHARGATI